MKLFAWTIFVSAFLLFQVQPMIGKFILPWFGSTPGVWTTCMLFFQLLLLAGYAYAHFIVSWLAPRNQALVHVGLLVAAAVTAHIAPGANWKPTDPDTPVQQILVLLLVAVGLPYFVLSATGPLLQGWFARIYPGVSPYRLYALSNVGSLLALLSYPFVFERFLKLQEQAWWWMYAYWVFVLLCGWCAWMLMRWQDEPVMVFVPIDSPAADSARPSIVDMSLWLLLATCGSVVLVATTNQMCLDIAVVPFLWVLPLSLYLVTFIICFDSPHWYFRPLFCVTLPIGVIAGCVALLWGNGTIFGISFSLPEQVFLYSLALFFCCMSCHGELVRTKPAPRHLTLFYLLVSLGGALGGIFVGVVAPNVFSGVWEYHLGLFGSCLLVSIAVGRDFLENSRAERRAGNSDATLNWARGLAGVAAGVGLAVLATVLLLQKEGWEFAELSEFEIAQLEDPDKDPEWLDQDDKAPGDKATNDEPRSYLGGMLLAKDSKYTFFRRWKITRDADNLIEQRRNFYGVLRVERKSAGDPDFEALELTHGRINHGQQFMDAQRRLMPTSYYGGDSGIGLAIEHHPRREARKQLRMGVVGLGTGTLAAYSRSGDYIRFYEINPLVLEWSGLEGKHFTYLHDAKKNEVDVGVFMGDARIVMERQIADKEFQEFDVLAIDAFSSDAIPIHLLTKEAFQTYWQHLREGGILVVHISNRFLNLQPVVRRLAAEAGHRAMLVSNSDDDAHGISASSWVIVTSNDEFLELNEIQRAKNDWHDGLLWTDDFSSVFEILETD
jgi:spermidine synthase